MTPIIDLQWRDGTAYGPRGAQYRIVPVGGLHQCSVVVDGRSSVLGAGDEQSAMLMAQSHAAELSERYGAEGDAINSASDRRRVTIG